MIKMLGLSKDLYCKCGDRLFLSLLGPFPQGEGPNTTKHIITGYCSKCGKHYKISDIFNSDAISLNMESDIVEEI